MSDRQSEPGERSRILELLNELQKRRVIRTALYYCGLSVAIVEGADAFAEPLGLPTGAVRFMAVLAVGAFPLVIVLSWLFDISGDATSGRAPGRAGRAFVILSATAGSLALVAVLWTRPSSDDIPIVENPSVTRVAVLPFEAPGRSQDLLTLAEHLHGRLIDGLSAAIRAPGSADPDRYKVISRAGVLPFAGGTVTLDSIGRALQVGTIVEGVLELARDSVRVRLRLIDARSADQLDSRVAAAPVGEPVALVDHLAETGVSMLREQLGAVVRRRAQLLGTRSSDAFRHVLWAEEVRDEFDAALVRGDLAQAARSLGRTDSLYAEAARLDPEWVEPVVLRGRLGDRYAQLAIARRDPTVEPVHRRVLELAEQALEIDPSDRQALNLRGTARGLLAQVTADPVEAEALRVGAEADLRASILGNPTPAPALRRLSELLAAQGRFEEALEFGNRAYREDRYLRDAHAILLRLFEYSLGLGRDEEAARHCAEGRRQHGIAAFEDCHLVLMAWSDVVGSHPDSAWAAVDRALAGYPSALRSRLEPRLHVMAAAVLAEHGLSDSARAVLARARDDDEGTVGVALGVAGALMRLGDGDAALSEVRRALDSDAWTVDAVAAAPEVRALRTDPRFDALLDSIRVGGTGR